MKNSVKLIIALFLSSFLFSCASSNEDVIPSESRTDSIVFTPSDGGNFLNVTMVPIGAVCNKDFIVNVKIINSSGYEYSETVAANENGIVHFSHENDFKSGAYGVYFTLPSDQSIIGSTSFYLTSEDLEKDYYNKTMEYNNCDM